MANKMKNLTREIRMFYVSNTENKICNYVLYGLDTVIWKSTRDVIWDIIAWNFKCEIEDIIRVVTKTGYIYNHTEHYK